MMNNSDNIEKTNIGDSLEKLLINFNECSQNVENLLKETTGFSQALGRFNRLYKELMELGKNTEDISRMNKYIERLNNELASTTVNMNQFVDQLHSNIKQVESINTFINDATQTLVVIKGEIIEARNITKETTDSISKDVSEIKEELLEADKTVTENFQEINLGIQKISNKIKSSYENNNITFMKLNTELNAYNNTLSSELKQTLENTTNIKNLVEKATYDNDKAIEFFFTLIDEWASQNIRYFNLLRNRPVK